MSIDFADPYWYEVVAQMSYAEVQAATCAVGCACRSDDAHQCTRIRYPADYEFSRECGMETACPCDCHEIWEAWLEDDDDDA